MPTRRTIAAAVLAVVAASAAILLIIGGGDESATETDGAFVAEMAPHHESAIAMAEIAQERAEHPEIESLADEIIASQSSELETLNAIHERLYGTPVGEMQHGSMGLSDEQMGVHMDSSSLEDAKPFDREFIDMMIPHHQGAIVMARTELAEGEDAETKALATEIIDVQASEIEQMNQWREEWYGQPSPSGGVPADDESAATGSDDGPHADH